MSKQFKVGLVAPSASLTSASISSASIYGGTLTNVLRDSGSISGTLTNLGFISGGSANFISASINGVAISTGGGGTPTNIAATTGTVGGWQISASSLTTQNVPGSIAGLVSSNNPATTPLFFSGAQDLNGGSAKFTVSGSGLLTSQSSSITAGYISGSVVMQGGDAGGLHFNSTAVSVQGSNGSAGFYTSPANNLDTFMWSGSATTSYNVAPFRVNYSGDVVARNVTVSGSITASTASFTSASISGSAIATQAYVTSLGYLTSSGSIATASNSASLGGIAASSYAQLSSANFTAASVGGNPIYTLTTAPYQSIPFSYTGTVAVYTSSARFYNDTGGTRSILSVRASVGTAPTGSAMIVDVRKNDTAASATIFTASGITIAASTNTISATTGFNSGSSVAAGDYLTVAIKQVGSTVAGADLSVVVNWR